MLTHVTNFAHTRTMPQAFVFFLVYTIVLVGLSTFFGHYMSVFGMIDGTKVGSFFDGGHLHTMIGTGWVMVLSSLILSSKKLTNDMMSVVISMVGIYLAYTTDVLLGMTVVAYLTTTGK